MEKFSEAQMIKDCYNKLLKNKSYKEIVLEVPFMSRCIDMVIVDKDNHILSIEFKLKNIKHALQQARDHKMGADKSYVCIPKRTKGISKYLAEEFDNYGVGLFMYDPENDNPFEEVISPKFNNERWEQWEVSLKNLINKISNKNLFNV